MDFLSGFFIAVASQMLIFGILINYFTPMMPDTLVSIFRYGRANVRKRSNIILQSLEMPKRWFGHFYLYAVILQLSVLYTVVNKYFYGDGASYLLSKTLGILSGTERETTVSATTTLVACALFQFHLCRRLYENYFVSIFSDTKMNIFHYGLAFMHYTATILSVVAHSPGFGSLSSSHEDFVLSSNEISKGQLLGILLFFYANYQQYMAHKTYASLRKREDGAKVTPTHKIPRGGMFELISCPNYWAEILIYCAFAIIFNVENKTWNYCTLWVVLNQIMSGVMNHKWYIAKFGDEYPQTRKAVIPYVL